MDQFRKIIEHEERRLERISADMRSTLFSEDEDRRKFDKELVDLKVQKLEAPGWREKQEIEDLIASCRARYSMRRFQDPKVLNQPYFGVLEIEDDDLGSLSYCLGARSFFGAGGKALVIDWREAPISRLYYEYEPGELYEETIQRRDRTGEIRAKRQVDTSGGELTKIVEGGLLLARNRSGEWCTADQPEGAVSRKEEKADHRLPEITSLISRDQFRAITNPESSTVILEGGAGSGKTTVGLHRIAYLTYQDPERFRSDRILVVMFNRSLQQYIAGVLPSLGVAPGVHVETYHNWAGKLLRKANALAGYTFESPPHAVVQLKKHPLMLAVLERYIDALFEKSREWLLDQLRRSRDPYIELIEEALAAAPNLKGFRTLTDQNPLFCAEPQPDARKWVLSRIRARLNDHLADLQASLCDRKLLEDVLIRQTSGMDNASLDQVINWQTRLSGEGKIDFADTGILLTIMQLKGVPDSLPSHGHIMVDEAQDLSVVEINTLLRAADETQSITICGDMAQRIKGDVSFAGSEGFADFVRKAQQRSGGAKVRADRLIIGYRATRQIMELAWYVLGTKGSMATPRDGAPVEILRSESHDDTVRRMKGILSRYISERPKALIGVVCRYKADADQIYRDLHGLDGLRRHQRDDFSFDPGIVVTNAHQVKGLEFSAVLVVNPSAGQYRDDPESRMLLHVVLTRASDHLWIVGHQPMAYDIEQWLPA